MSRATSATSDNVTVVRLKRDVPRSRATFPVSTAHGFLNISHPDLTSWLPVVGKTPMRTVYALSLLPIASMAVLPHGPVQDTVFLFIVLGEKWRQTFVTNANTIV
uniref:Uncharacterized protein n=1 Tax=Sipha flava TaxID=143950 RepID=A0A2S2Q345_9HEMI